MTKKINIIGAGLAGSEAAYQLAKKGYLVSLYEMRPLKMTPAHETANFAELVCSNSLRSNDPNTAVGMLKREMEMFDSLVMRAAHQSSVPAGSSLAVDRKVFSAYIENEIRKMPNITIMNEEVKTLDLMTPTVVCAGPLVSSDLHEHIKHILDNKSDMHFFDAIAPIIAFDSIDMNIAYFKSRYDKGEASYINCPMDKQQYEAFYEALVNAKTADIQDFENNVFEGCMPVEVMAKRGFETLTFGPLKPVGLERVGEKRSYAVVQLRQDDAIKSMYNIVGFQTHLTWGEQKRIIQMIPGLENAHILRYGVMHRNSYLESPKVLNQYYQSKKYSNLFFAGQISGVEGYVESSASAILASHYMDQYLKGETFDTISVDTMMGAMARYISTPNQSFVPMNANLGLLDELGVKHHKKDRKMLYSKRSIDALTTYLKREV